MDWFEITASLLRGIHVAALLSLFGCLVFRGLVSPADVAAGDAPRAMAIRIGSVSLWLALAFGGAWLVATSAAITGADNFPSVLRALPAVTLHTDFGNVICARLLLLLGVLPLLRRQTRLGKTAGLIASAVAVALQPWLGHIDALTGSTRTVLIPVEIAHLLAAGAWLGGLLPLMLCVLQAPPPLAAALCERFTPVGLVAVGTIALTAFPQAGGLIGELPSLFGTQYGQLALTKLGLFFLALGLACVNRLFLTARLGSAGPRPARDGTRNWLIASIAIEAMVGLCVVLAAAAMASSPPAIHVQPVWPFRWRLSTVAWQEPDLRGELVRLLFAVGAGVALIGASKLVRRFRVLACVLAVIVIAPFAPSLGLLLVDAYPTSYARSTTGFSVTAIVRGEILFGQQCAICHDAKIGAGGAIDLTGSHLWGHLDGDLFWRITDGVADPDGAALMPGFGSMLSEDDRWALIDFMHARNVGVQARDTGKWSPPVPAPATPLNCDGGEAGSLADLGSHDVLLVADGDRSAATVVGQGSISGIEKVRLVRGAGGAPEEGKCVTSAAVAWEAWRVLSGVATDRFGGYRAVVDSQGWLRAWLPPDSGPERLPAAVRDADSHPIGAAGSQERGHRH
jgi:putative copper export protein/mono/diheme cytochrome c family protein